MQARPRLLVLGSSSPARRELLQRLSIPFKTASPNLDETPLPGEKAIDLVKRLAEAKAKTVSAAYPDALIIGADQVGALDDIILCKPLTHTNAFKQLQLVSGKTVRFYTGMCVLDSKTQHSESTVATYDVSFLPLTDSMIDNYLHLEEALHCAGSFQAEGLGIALISKFAGDDYTSLIGLPMIQLVGMLKKLGLDILTP
jgi:septum formation protein